MAGNRVSADSTDETGPDVDRHGEHGTAIGVPGGTAGGRTLSGVVHVSDLSVPWFRAPRRGDGSLPGQWTRSSRLTRVPSSPSMLLTGDTAGCIVVKQFDTS